MKFGGEAFFPQTKKKTQIRGCTGRKRPEQEWISETTRPVDADRQVGLVSQIVPCFMSGRRRRLRILGGLEHLWVVCLVGKVRTFVFVFSVVLPIGEQDVFQLMF